MWREYSDIFGRIGNTAWIRVVVLASSSDKFFTSGLDGELQQQGHSVAWG